MPTPDHLLSALRGITHAALDPDDRWHALTTALDAWPRDLIAEYALPYLDGALRDDTSERLAPPHWIAIEAQGVTVHPAWPLVRALMLDVPDVDVAALVGSASLRAIVRLKITMGGLDAASAGELVRGSAQLGQLTHLSLTLNRLGDEGASALAEALHLTRLTHLDLSYNGIGEAGAHALVSSPHLAQLTHLDLSANKLGEAGARAIAEASRLSQLTHLNVNGNNLRHAGARALANSPQLAALTSLDLSYNHIRDAGAMALAKTKHLTQLTHLNLRSNNIKEAPLRALADSPKLGQLTHLDLSQNYFSHASTPEPPLTRQHIITL